MPLRSSLTPAVVLAPWLGRGLAALGLLFCALGWAAHRSASRGRATMGEDGPTTTTTTTTTTPVVETAPSGRSQP
jgi:hypothetical protein